MATLRKQLEQARTQAGHSFSLWKNVNQHIARIIDKGVLHKRSRAHIAAKLRDAAGPKKKDEPVCLINYRAATKSVEDSTDLVLI
jgi:hypothetical protein